MNEDRKPLSPYVGIHPASAHSAGEESASLDPLHAFTSRPIAQSEAILTATDLHNIQHLLPILVKANPQLAPKPSTLPPHPTVAQVLTAIPLGFKMAYKQLQSPTPYGNQIAAYKIYKNQTANSFSGAALWETRPHDNAVNQKTVTLQDSTAGGGLQWYYFVSSVDTAGQESSPVAFQAGAVTSQNANPNVASISVGPGSTMNSATPAQIPSLSKTLTTTGKNVLVSCNVGILFSVSGTANIFISRDGSQISGTLPGIGATSAELPFSMSWIDATPPAGSHTYAVFWASLGSTQIQTVGIASLQVVELG